MAYGSGSCNSSDGGNSVSTGVVGGTIPSGDTLTLNDRLGHTGDQIFSEYASRYGEATRRGEMYAAGSQTGVTFTVGLATTYTGFILINPINSGVYAELVYAKATLSIAASVPGPIGLIGGGSAAGVTTYTAISTALWGSTKLDSNAATNASKCAVAAAGITLVGAPRYVDWLGIAGTVATTSLGLAQGLLCEYAGSIVVGPGGYIAFGSNVAEATALCAFIWRETAWYPNG